MAPRKRKFIAFAALFGVVLIVLPALVYQSPGYVTWDVRIGVGVVLVAIALFAWVMRAKTGRRIAMESCTLCARKILFEHEGEFCEVCDKPAHGKCIGEHRANLHRAPTAPFR